MKSNINHPLRTFQSIEAYWKQGNIYKFTTPGYPSLPAEEHYKDGWREYVAPEYDPATHRLAGLIYDEGKDIVTNQLIAFSEEEIAQRQQAALDSDESAQKLATNISSGQAMYQKFFAHIQRQFDKGGLTANQAKNSVSLLWLPLLPINYGQFIVAQINLNALTPPVNTKELAILNLAKQEISEYILK